MSRRLLAAGLLFTIFALSACETSRNSQEPTEDAARAELSDSSASLRNRR